MELYFYSSANFEAPAFAFPLLQLSLCVPKSFMVEKNAVSVDVVDYPSW